MKGTNTRIWKQLLILTAIWSCLVAFGCQSSGERRVVDIAIADDLQITLDRRGCFGTCPVYLINITSDGSVSFDGKGFTKIKGRAQDKVSREAVLKLVAEFKKADFFELESAYGNCDDTPLEFITFVQNGVAKTVSHGVRCNGTPNSSEEAIANLGRQIDAVTKSDRWVGIEPNS